MTPSPGMANKIARPNIMSLKSHRCACNDYDSGILFEDNKNVHSPTIGYPEDDDSKISFKRYPSLCQEKPKRWRYQRPGAGEELCRRWL